MQSVTENPSGREIRAAGKTLPVASAAGALDLDLGTVPPGRQICLACLGSHFWLPCSALGQGTVLGGAGLHKGRSDHIAVTSHVFSRFIWDLRNVTTKSLLQGPRTALVYLHEV